MSAECSAGNIPPGYKQTEVGVIPEDWKITTLGEIVGKFVNGGTPSTKNEDYWKGNIPWITGADILEQQVSEIRRFITKDAVKNSSTNIVSKGNLLLVSRTGVGKLAIAPCDIAISQDFTGIYTKSENLNAEYLFRFFDMNQSFLKNQNQGTSILGITRETLSSIIIFFPPTKAEQEAIAEALSDADALIESLEQLIAKKRQIKQGAMHELLTGKRRLPGFSGEWGMHNLRKFVRSFIVPMRDKPKRFAGDIPWCRIEDFDGIYLRDSKSDQRVDIETIHTMNLKVYPTGTLLVSCSADLGRCAIVARPLVSNQTFIGLEMDETVSSNLFFYYYMTSKADELNNLSSGTTISYLSREQFEEFGVFVPRDKQEQNAIAAILSDMDSEITALEEKLAKAHQIKQGMMQELLTGRIRLI